MTGSVTSAAVFACVVFGILCVGSFAYDLVYRRRWVTSERLRRKFQPQGPSAFAASEETLQRDQFILQAVMNRLNSTGNLATLITKSGVRIQVTQLLGICLLAGLLAACLGVVLSGDLLISMAISIAASILPIFYLMFKVKQRRTKLRKQLPDAFELISRALRAAQSVPTAFHTVATEFPAPISEEFAYCSEQQHLGVPFATALRDLANRTGLIEMRIFSTALILNHQLGGNLAEVNNRLAVAMRKREMFNARVRAITGEGRMQANVLTALPILAFIGVYFVEPNYLAVLLDRPYLLMGMATSQIIGTLMIRQIVNVRF
ncbi:type II secretion system F family protein [Aureliella helgolandensis]|uniref:Bacterial type II secretion system protein F domain protein n=1 Tax=Aureliella helgolandensis TaxID=2527968 RepID=A0A518G3Y4_9BACT|nr:type II secretion system F family protein [Aureliella helgolandensis]QDV23302.1 Bacterial type II secretion system protein F domain protein [Aureliella helgolandensis]